jgi:hypothetical protein
MSETAEKTDPALWERVKAEITAGAKGGKPGQWSARKAQMAVLEYQHRGGAYVGARDPHNSLHEWTGERWTTKSGAKSGETGERYLPEAAIGALSDEEYARTTAAKRAATKQGHQFAPQPADVAAKTRPFREHRTRAELYAEATRRGVKGRSRMTKDQLSAALAG